MDSPPSDPERVAAGALAFEQHCGACHGLATTGTAPGMGGLIGRPAGSTAFANSTALAQAGFVWDAERLDAFLTDPRAVIPENQMVFYGLDSPEDRRSIIAYIMSL